MRVVFSPQANSEFADGEHYYEQRVPGLGSRFRKEVKDALVRFLCIALDWRGLSRLP